MKVLFDNRQNIEIFDDYEEIVKNAIEKSLEVEGLEKKYEISVSFVENKEIKNLNCEYRDVDRETDVLSFPTDMVGIDMGDIDTPLGDIVISVEKAEEQAKDFGHSTMREIVYLTVHSMFHLMGYDHMVEEDKKIMRNKEKQTISLLGIYRNEN